MKGIGLGAAGLGAAAATAPVFHDLDELTSDSRTKFKIPWWIKEVDQPTIEIDWSMVVRSDKKINGHDGIPYGERIWRDGDKHALRPGVQEGGRKPAEDYIKSKFPDWKGDTLRDQALREAAWTNAYGRQSVPFVPLKKSKPPEAYGLPRYQGNPEDNYIMVRNLLRYYGAHITGVVELDANTRKLFYARSRSKEYVFEDVGEAYVTDTKQVIPSKNKYLIVALFNAPQTLARRWPSLQSNAAVMFPYNLMKYAQSMLQEFFYGLGYEGNVVDGITNSEPCGIVSGGGENSRMGYNVVSPLTGAMARTVCRMTTDLPLAPTKPVDGGVTRFCKTCMICAESCAYDAILFDDDTSWDHTAIPGSPPGYNGWRYKSMECAHCGSACQAVCPFNGPRDSWIHQFVVMTQATTPIFNSFFANMERTFGYDMWDPESFWTEDNAPVLGYYGSFLES